MAGDLSSHDDGVAFLISAEVVFAIIAAFCSSPQTAEINADKRADTLMKWVWLGMGTSALFVAMAVYFTDSRKKPVIVGGALAGGILGAAYAYAKHSGLRNAGNGTES